MPHLLDFDTIRATLGRTGPMHKAWVLATLAHKGQLYGPHPYTVHLEQVVAILKRFGHNSLEELEAGYLHDVLEDTPITSTFLSEFFCARTVAMVLFCTDEPGDSRSARKEKTHARMRIDLDLNRPHAHDAIPIKLADRMANMRSCLLDGNPRLLGIYHLEYPALRQAIHVPGQHDSMWDVLAQMQPASGAEN